MPLSKNSFCDMSKAYAGNKQKKTFQKLMILAVVTLVSHWLQIHMGIFIQKSLLTEYHFIKCRLFIETTDPF